MNWVLIVACFLIAACGRPATSPGANPGGSPQGQPIADVLRIVCESDGTRVETPRVRAFPDGVRAHFDNPAGAVEYWVRAVTTPDEGNHGGKVPQDQEQWGRWSDPPGEYFIGCYDKGETLPYYEPDTRYARYEVVDVDELWISWVPDCEHPEEIGSESLPEASSIEDVETWIRDRFDIHVGTRVRPGYPATQWKGNPWVIRDEDRTLVHFHAMEEDGTWILHRAEGCSSS